MFNSFFFTSKQHSTAQHSSIPTCIQRPRLGGPAFGIVLGPLAVLLRFSVISMGFYCPAKGDSGIERDITFYWPIILVSYAIHWYLIHQIAYPGRWKRYPGKYLWRIGYTTLVKFESDTKAEQELESEWFELGKLVFLNLIGFVLWGIWTLFISLICNSELPDL
jgi:hypothetical protein